MDELFKYPHITLQEAMARGARVYFCPEFLHDAAAFHALRTMPRTPEPTDDEIKGWQEAYQKLCDPKINAVVQEWAAQNVTFERENDDWDVCDWSNVA